MRVSRTLLSRTAPTPLYHQLKSILLERIQSGALSPNDRLPTEDELEAEFRVSKSTIRQALNLLVASGFVRREQGRGTFVAEPKVELGPRELLSFENEMRKHGLAPGTRVLEQEVIEAGGEISRRLSLRDGETVFRLRRVRLADGQPMGIQEAYVPLKLAPGLAEVNFNSNSLYEVLESRWGLVPAYAHETHYAVTVRGEDAALLEIEDGSAGLAAERLTFLEDRRPMELVFSVMRGDRYRVTLNLVRNVKNEGTFGD